MTRYIPRTPQHSEVSRKQFKRSARKPFEFQHDGHIDFKFIDTVKLDEKVSSIVENDVKFIKNASQSGGDSKHIEAELIHLQHLGTDGKSIRNYRSKKDVLFKHDADDEVHYSIRQAPDVS